MSKNELEYEKKNYETLNIENEHINYHESSTFISDKDNKNYKDKYLLDSLKDENEIFYDDLNKIINDAGYNLLIYKNIFLCFLSIFITGFHIKFFGFINIAFQQYYQISNTNISLILSLVFIGLGVGYLTLGFILDPLNRRQLIIISLIVILISTLMSAQVHNIIVFGIFRFIGSVFSAYYVIISSTSLAEYLPNKFRGFVLTLINSAIYLSLILFLYFCSISIPNLSYDPLDKKTPQDFHTPILNFVYIELFALIFAYFFYRDSPRNLFLKNQKEEAGEILEYYVNRKLTKKELDAIENNLFNTGENLLNKKYSNLILLFSRRYLKLTLLFLGLYVLVNFSLHGMNTAYPIILRSNTSDAKTHPKEINNLMLYCLSQIPLLPSILAEFKSIGKKYSIGLLILVSLIFGIFSLVISQHFNIFLFISMSLFANAFYLLETWTNEILPTRIRDSGYGLFRGVAKIGAFFSQFVLVSFAKKGREITIIAFLICLLLLLIIICFLPKNEIDDLDSTLDLSHASKSSTEKKL
jgi:MFS family permease